MLRIIAICLAILAIIIAVFSTIQQIQPALFFIELTTVYGKFPASAVMLLTALSLLLPIVGLTLLIGKLNNKKNNMPDLTGRTGVVVVRKKALYNGLYTANVLIDGKVMSAVSNGKSTFINLPIGQYYLQINSKKKDGITIKVTGNTIVKVEMSYIDEGLKAKLNLQILN